MRSSTLYVTSTTTVVCILSLVFVLYYLLSIVFLRNISRGRSPPSPAPPAEQENKTSLILLCRAAPDAAFLPLALAGFFRDFEMIPFGLGVSLCRSLLTMNVYTITGNLRNVSAFELCWGWFPWWFPERALLLTFRSADFRGNARR